MNIIIYLIEKINFFKKYVASTRNIRIKLCLQNMANQLKRRKMIVIEHWTEPTSDSEDENVCEDFERNERERKEYITTMKKLETDYGLKELIRKIKNQTDLKTLLDNMKTRFKHRIEVHNIQIKDIKLNHPYEYCALIEESS